MGWWLVSLGIALVCGFAGYREASSRAKRTGDTPWGWSPWAWAGIWFWSFLLGVVLMAIATQGEPREPVIVRPSWVLRHAAILVGFPLGALLTLGGLTSLARGDRGAATPVAFLVLGTAFLGAAVYS